MTTRNKGGVWFGAVTLLGAALLGGCSSNSSESVTQDATTLVAQTVETTADSSDAVEVSNLLRGLHELRPEAVEGMHCDSSPDVTSITVCGKSLPATVHLAWTECAAPGKPGKPGDDPGGPPGGGHDHGGPGGGHGGPGPGDGSGGQAPTPPTPPTPPPAPPTPPPAPPAPPPGGEGKGPRFGPSSGTVDITYTYTASEDCTGGVTQHQAVAFQVSRTDEDGAVSTQQGSTSGTALLLEEGPPQKKAAQADVTRTLTDAAGTVVRSVHLTGSTTTDFSTDTPPVRTLNGSYTEEHLDGTTGTVTLTNIVRPPRHICPWPISGSLTRASADTSHTLAFGPDCGAATLDGTAVDLSEHRHPEPGGGKGGGKGGPGKP